MDIIIDDKEATEDLVAKIKKEIEDIQNSSISDIELQSNYVYMYNIAWMKLYNIMMKNMEETINKKQKYGEKS